MKVSTKFWMASWCCSSSAGVWRTAAVRASRLRRLKSWKDKGESLKMTNWRAFELLLAGTSGNSTGYFAGGDHTDIYWRSFLKKGIQMKRFTIKVSISVKLMLNAWEHYHYIYLPILTIYTFFLSQKLHWYSFLCHLSSKSRWNGTLWNGNSCMKLVFTEFFSWFNIQILLLVPKSASRMMPFTHRLLQK